MNKVSLKAFDTADSTQDKAHALWELGYKAVGVYLRPDRLTREELSGLFSVGFKVFSIAERGNPTKPSYFTKDQAKFDAEYALTWAQKFKQPKNTPIHFTMDYDSKIEEVDIYVETLHTEVTPEGYWSSLYGNGTCLLHFNKMVGVDGHNVCHSMYLSQSKGFDGWKDCEPYAAIVQGPVTKILGLDCDLDTIIDSSVLWG